MTKKAEIRKLFKSLRKGGVPFIVAAKSAKQFFRDYNVPEELIAKLSDLGAPFQVEEEYHDDYGRVGWETTVTLGAESRVFDMCDYDYSYSRQGPFRPHTSQYTVR